MSIKASLCSHDKDAMLKTWLQWCEIPFYKHALMLDLQRIFEYQH